MEGVQRDYVQPESMISTYRRAGTDITGAVRARSIEVLFLEQMEGGKFHAVAHTTSGLDVLVSELLPNIHHARLMIEEMRLYLAGLGGLPRMPSELKAEKASR